MYHLTVPIPFTICLTAFSNHTHDTCAGDGSNGSTRADVPTYHPAHNRESLYPENICRNSLETKMNCCHQSARSMPECHRYGDLYADSPAEKGIFAAAVSAAAAEHGMEHHAAEVHRLAAECYTGGTVFP